jgi:hypothetical protein
MLTGKARGVRGWIRLNLFDFWQVLGTIGLVLGAFAFAILLANARDIGRTRTIHEFQTLVSQPLRIDPSDEPSAEPAPAPAPVAKPASGGATPRSAAARHVVRPAIPVPEASIIPTLSPSIQPTDTPTPTPTASDGPSPTPAVSGSG